ncbi:MAG: hypothetical protein KAT25_08870 [Sulfuriflexus sp.]|nr:hypothetical protein [Sulfuriflexus sp.]
MKLRNVSIACAFALAVPLAATADNDNVDIGKLFTGKDRVQQNELYELSLQELRLAGMRMFTNPFTKADGFGDGNDNPPTGSQGQRGTLQGNGTFQRIGGLDAQTCLECHSIISRRTVPMTFGIGGVGGVNNTVLGAGGNTFVDLNLQGRSNLSTTGVTLSQANIDGRVINPPFIFGAGGIELLANEMTDELQTIVKAAKDKDGTYPLIAKGVSFGSITSTDGVIDATNAEGTANLNPAHDDFLVVQPFGRKGNEKSTRTFDIGALSFHFGMGVATSREDEAIVFDSYGERIEITETDHDNDGVHNEVTQGELSALSVFVATAQTPFAKEADSTALHGRQIMQDIGCTECHVPSMNTNGKNLGLRFPEIANNPSANIHTSVDLTGAPMNFAENDNGGITIELFADLKRHYMGPSLAEFDGDAMFTTMRLWGVADTAPYLHDGRALTITDAIVEHGADASSEANGAVTAFSSMNARDKNAVLAFLDTLRSPDGTFDDLQDLAKNLGENKHGHR